MPMSAMIRAVPTANPQQILASVWQRNLPLVRQRLECLRSAAWQASVDQMSPSTRREAGDIAHKLAGSLGMFGYLQGTEIARALELLLDGEEPVSALHFQELTTQLDRELAL